MRKLKVYLDTSVISHLQAEDAPEKMVSTLKLWDEIRQGHYDIYISGLVIAEIDECPDPKRAELYEYLREINFNEVVLNDEVEALARKYIEEGIIPLKYEDDATHIAVATVYHCNAIASWNFKHMVKLKTIIGVNGINKFMGYADIEILSPDSIVGEDE